MQFLVMQIIQGKDILITNMLVFNMLFISFGMKKKNREYNTKPESGQFIQQNSLTNREQDISCYFLGTSAWAVQS